MLKLNKIGSEQHEHVIRYDLLSIMKIEYPKSGSMW